MSKSTARPGRPKQPKTSDVIKYVRFTPGLLKALEDYRQHAMISTDVEAMRVLLAEALRSKGFLK